MGFHFSSIRPISSPPQQNPHFIPEHSPTTVDEHRDQWVCIHIVRGDPPQSHTRDERIRVLRCLWALQCGYEQGWPWLHQQGPERWWKEAQIILDDKLELSFAIIQPILTMACPLQPSSSRLQANWGTCNYTTLMNDPGSSTTNLVEPWVCIPIDSKGPPRMCTMRGGEKNGVDDDGDEKRIITSSEILGSSSSLHQLNRCW